jgi:two-component system alkaline phosphatase synthesis response regulator PhoP
MAKKVLVIEDRRENIVFIANNILKPEGWEVITARDGELGLQKAIEEKPDLIITDLKLPGMHGLDVLEALNKRGLHIPAIVMTFHGSEETAIRAFRLGAADYLIKPFDIEDMLAAVNRALSGGYKAGAGPAPTDAGVSEKLAAQEREIQQLKALVQQKENALQEHQRAGPAPSEVAGADIGRWQALVKEREAALSALQKQIAVQGQEISYLKAQLVERDVLLRASGAHPAGAGGDLAARLAEKEAELAKADRVVKVLTRAIAAQQKTVAKQREEADRLARELHAMAVGIQMLGQSLGDQTKQMVSAVSGEK